MTAPEAVNNVHRTPLSRFQAKTTRLGRFLVVGVVGTVVYYFTLWIMVEMLRVQVLAATSIAFVLVTLENYILHHGWTFASTNAHAVAFPKFVFMNIVGFWINWGIMASGLHYLSVNYMIIQIFAIGAVVTWNFIVTSYWIFRETKKQTDE